MEVATDALTDFYFVEQEEKPAYLDDLPNHIGPGTCISVRGFIKQECARCVH